MRGHINYLIMVGAQYACERASGVMATVADVVGDSDCHLGAWQLQLDTSYRADMYHLRYNLSSSIK